METQILPESKDTKTNSSFEAPPSPSKSREIRPSDCQFNELNGEVLVNDLNMKKEDVAEEVVPDQKHETQEKNEVIESANLFPLRFMLLLFITIGVYFWKASSSASRDSACAHDFVHEKLESVNAMIGKEPSLRNVLQVSSSAMVDFIYLSTLVYWVFQAKSSRLIMNLVVFYAVRWLIQFFFLFGFPDGYSWDDPSFPSLVVAYGRNSDFFFSGQTGFLVICALEWGLLNFNKMAYLTHGINAYVAAVMLICRTHYSIDIIVGLIMGHYTYMLVNNKITSIDAFLSQNWRKVCSYIDDRKRSAKQNIQQNDRLIFEPTKKTTVKAYEIDF